jgi:anti-sigma regulatory factor (Ser/Thr protein kinase)
LVVRQVGDSTVELMSSTNKPARQKEACTSHSLVCAMAPTPAVRGAAFSVPAVPASVGLARAMFKAVLVSWKSGVDDDTAALLLSELITNAVVHGVPGPGCALRIGVEVVETAGRLHVEVHDPDLGARGGVAMRQEVGEQDEGGRGLSLVNVLASSWGERTMATGKCVYFDLVSEEHIVDVNDRAQNNATPVTLSTQAAENVVACGRSRRKAVLTCRVGAAA